MVFGTRSSFKLQVSSWFTKTERVAESTPACSAVQYGITGQTRGLLNSTCRSQSKCENTPLEKLVSVSFAVELFDRGLEPRYDIRRTPNCWDRNDSDDCTLCCKEIGSALSKEKFQTDADGAHSVAVVCERRI